MNRRRALVWSAGVVLALVAFVGLYAGATWYTSRPAFCPTCHEMSPYYDAWRTGKHAETSCIDCHVDPGFIADAKHKLVALKEVWDHFTTKPTFPGPEVDLPDGRCQRCHPEPIAPTIKNFDHTQHESKRTCKTCHRTDGHRVTAEALRAAGVLNEQAQAKVDAGGAIAGGGAALQGHVTVICSDCHNMATAPCDACHDRPAGHAQGDCVPCHKPGPSWAFAHPRVSGEHSYTDFPCEKCHPVGPPGVNCTCHPGGQAPQDD